MRRMIVAGILSLLYSGLGQLYNGQRKKGFLFLIGQLIALLAYLYTMGAQVIFLYFFGVWLWSLIDALYTARQIDQGKVNAPSSKQPRKRWIEISLVALSAYLAGFLFYQALIAPIDQASSAEDATIQSEIKQYLETRYGQSFVVEEPTYLPETEEYQLYAYPKEDPKLRFIVSKSPDRLIDGYISLFYKKEAQKELATLMEETYPDAWHFETKVGVGRLEGNFAEGIPSYRKTRQSHPEKLLQEVDIDLISELNEGNKEEELGKILRLLRHYRETGLQNIKFTISFFDKQLLKEEGVLPDHKKKGTYEKNYLRHQISVGVADRVETIDDVADLLENFPPMSNEGGE